MIKQQEQLQKAAEEGSRAESGADAVVVGGTRTDIRERLKAMQGSSRRVRAVEEDLLHQSRLSGQSVTDVSASVMTFLNEALPQALGAICMRFDADISTRARKANSFMNGSFQVPVARILELTAAGIKLEALVEKTGFFGNIDTSVETVRCQAFLCSLLLQKDKALA
jgi:hypothetical protein